MSSRRIFLFGLATLALGAACKRKREVVVYTSVDQVFSEPIFRDFEKSTGIKVDAVFDTEETKSTGVLSRLVAEKDHPQADVFWSGDPVRPMSLASRGMLAPYVSPSAADIPGAFKAADGTWACTAARARVLLVNKNLVKQGEAPKSIGDLSDPRFKGRCALANPLFGTTTMHVAALFSVLGEAKARSLLDGIKANGAKIASSNGEVKRLVATGEVAIGLTDTDDAHEALEDKAPVDVVYPDQDTFGTLIMPTTVVRVKGSPHAEEGKRLVDHLLSTDVEAKLAASAAHMPLRASVAVPPGVKRASELRAMSVDYAKVASEMEARQAWLRAWVGM